MTIVIISLGVSIVVVVVIYCYIIIIIIINKRNNSLINHLKNEAYSESWYSWMAKIMFISMKDFENSFWPRTMKYSSPIKSFIALKVIKPLAIFKTFSSLRKRA